MGYQIPGADYTSPTQLQTNVGAEVGRSLGSVMASFGKSLQAANEQAKKTAALQDQMKNTIMINNSKSVNKVLSAGKEQFGDDQVLYNEWKAEVVRKGEEATQAQIDFQFGDLDAAQKKQKLDIVGGFETYLNESKQNYGRFLADVSDMDADNMRIIGNSTNGEQQLNQIILAANSGGNAVDIFGDGATMTRSLSGDNKEIINTRVRIPVNSDTLKTLGGKSGGTSISVFEKGVADGIIKKNVGEDGIYYYEFDKKIDTSRYSKKGGNDFVIEKSTSIDPATTFQELGFADKEMIIDPAMYAKTASGDPATYTSSSTKDSQKGYVRTTNSEIIDISKMRGNEALGVTVNSEVEGILLNGRSTDAKLDSFSAYGIESLDAFPSLKNKYKTLRNFLNKGDVNQVNTFTNSVVTQTLFNKLFSKTDSKGDRVYTQKSADKNMVKFLNENSIMNEAGQPYEIGQTVYVKNKVIERQIQKDDGPSFIQKMQAGLKAEKPDYASLFAVPIKPKGYDQNIVYFEKQGDQEAGVYRVDKDGIKASSTPLPQSILVGLF